MNVLSVFDGISCGQLALQRAGIHVDNYYASEVDKAAIEVTQAHFPATIQLGDVCKITSNELPTIDLLMGGSPCQGFSVAGKQLNFDDPRSKLFFEFVRLRDELNPKWWLLENVVMKKEYIEIITQFLGVEPVLLNSMLVSAQKRRRLYWTNIPIIGEPEDKNITIKDILLPNAPGSRERYIEPSMVRSITNKKCPIVSLDGKAHTCTTKQRRWNNSGFVDDNGLRYFSSEELEALQTLPYGWTSGHSESERHKMIGNGWTVDMIAWIFSFIA